MSLYSNALRKARLPLAFALAAAAVAMGCGGGSDSPATGTVRVSLTDAPACGYDAVNVTVSKVRIHRSESAPEDDGAWSEIDVTPSRKINLLDLQNGVLHALGQTELEAGRYEQLRLVLEANGAGAPANSIVLTDDPAKAEIALRTPSGQQSGLKLVHGFEVAAGETRELVLDFDACKSVVKAGASGNYNLKPVVAVLPYDTSERLAIDGSVGVAGAGAVVTAQAEANGQPVILRATTADATGAFMLSPMPASPTGEYAVVITKPGYATVVVNGIPVDAGDITTLAAIDMIPASDGTVSGVVTVPSELAENVARVRAFRTVGAMPVEVASTTGVDGAYEMTLSAAPARLAVFAAGGLSFAEVAAPATYDLEAVIEESGLAAQTASVVLEDPPATKNFTFPAP